jgi:hypothetical protein
VPNPSNPARLTENPPAVNTHPPFLFYARGNRPLVAPPMYHLVIDRPGPHTVHVFLTRPLGRLSAPVHLAPLDPAARVACGAVRPAVGRDPNDPGRYVEFVSVGAAVLAGYEPVGLYRVCETWDEYGDPWPAGPAEAVGTLSAGETAGPTDFPFFAPDAAPARLQAV